MADFGSETGIPGNTIVDSQNPILPFGPTLDAWRSIGQTRLSLSVLNPLSDALPTAMQLEVLEGATGEVGVLNEGWWGMDVSPQQYNASFYVLPAAGNLVNPSHINVSLRSNLTGEVWSTTKIPIKSNLSDFSYTQLSAVIENSATAPNSNNSFAITFDASEVAGQSYYFGLCSLFPETYKDRPNGLRKDLAEQMKALNPKFLRFPGGNNLEGFSPSSRWKWWETVGFVNCHYSIKCSS